MKKAKRGRPRKPLTAKVSTKHGTKVEYVLTNELYVTQLDRIEQKLDALLTWIR